MGFKTTYEMEYDSISTAVIRHIDGSYYERGELETISATIDNISTFLGNLVELLNTKGIVSEEEIAEDLLRDLFG